MKKRQITILTILGLAAFILTFTLGRRVWSRFDLTANKAYTISEVSRNLYKEIPDQVRLTYYVSDKLKSYHPVISEIEDLMREYAAYSRGKIQLVVRDPGKTKELEQVERLGMQSQQIQTMEQNAASFAMVYSGVLIEYLDEIDVLPLVLSMNSLEYDITSRIRNMVRGTVREAGVIVADSFRSWKNDFAYVNQALMHSGYQIRLIVPGEEIPDFLPILVIIGGVEEFDDWGLYRIDRYIQLGGRVFFILEGVSVDTQGSLEARFMEDKGLLSMLACYGAEVQKKLVLDRSALTIQYQTRMANGALQSWVSRYPLWIGVQEENSNPNHPVSAHFGGIDLYWASPIVIRPSPGVEGTALFTTTREGWVMEDDFITDPNSGVMLARDSGRTKGVYNLAAALSGTFPAYFDGKPKPVRAGGADELPNMPENVSPSRIVVLGDIDAISTFSQYTGAADKNINFFLQASDWLGSDDDIIGIRGRESQVNRLNKILDLEKKASAMNFSLILNIVVIPLLLIAAGTFLFLKRRHSNGI